jgi:hypothetical protein
MVEIRDGIKKLNSREKKYENKNRTLSNFKPSCALISNLDKTSNKKTVQTLNSLTILSLNVFLSQISTKL